MTIQWNSDSIFNYTKQIYSGCTQYWEVLELNVSSLINSWINWDFSWSWSSTSWLVTLELECLWSGVWSVFSVCPRQFCDHDLLMWLCDMDQASDADLFYSLSHSFTSIYNREHSPQQSFPLLNFDAQFLCAQFEEYFTIVTLSWEHQHEIVERSWHVIVIKKRFNAN